MNDKKNQSNDSISFKFEEVRRRVDLVKLVRRYVPGLRVAGRTFKACCPFHKERTPSFCVNPERQIFHCLGCGRGGDAIAFLARIEHVTPLQAAIRLARFARVPIPRAYRFMRRLPKLKLAIPTGFRQLDRLLGIGLSRGDLTVLAGRSVDEVSSLAQRIASNVALKAKEPVLFISGMLQGQAVMDRMVAFEAHMNPADVHDQCPVLEKAEAQLHAAPLHIVQERTVEAIRAISGNLMLSLQKEMQNLGLVILDTLQTLQTLERRFPARLEETAEILMEARMLAVNLNAAVVVVSQLPAKPERNVSPTEAELERAPIRERYEYDRHEHLGPWLVELEGAGIEDYYDWSIILDRESSHRSDAARSEAKLFVARRLEPWRECKIQFDPATGIFSD